MTSRLASSTSASVVQEKSYAFLRKENAGGERRERGRAEQSRAEQASTGLVQTGADWCGLVPAMKRKLETDLRRGEDETE